jgi:hypothetical protein
VKRLPASPAKPKSEPDAMMGLLDKMPLPVATAKSNKIVVSLHSRYLFKMLNSKMREGAENTIRLTTNFPNSLRKLLQSFYEHVLEIGSAEELIELLYLADEYDVPRVMAMLKSAIIPKMSSASVFHEPCNLAFTMENARLFLTCSAKIGLKLEPKIFSGLAQQWWQFGPREGKELAYEEHNRMCRILLESLNFTE